MLEKSYAKPPVKMTAVFQQCSLSPWLRMNIYKGFT